MARKLRVEDPRAIYHVMNRGDRREAIFRNDAEQERAERMVKENPKGLKWQEADLAARPKGDRERVNLTLRLRAETAVTIKWIAQRLQMGTWTHANHLRGAGAKSEPEKYYNTILEL